MQLAHFPEIGFYVFDRVLLDFAIAIVFCAVEYYQVVARVQLHVIYFKVLLDQ